MKIKDVLQRDPATVPLVNQGQARIADRANDSVVQELKGELSTFVCEGQYADGIQRILSSYLGSLGQTSQKAAWVSGFFGSGKSHVLKMLCHLWQDTRFPDGSTARSLVPAMPDDLRALLRELDTAGKRTGGLVAAAGALPSGTTDDVRLTVLGVILRAVGLPEQYPQAQFCFWLRDHGYYDRVRGAVEAAGKTWLGELNNLYVSGVIARAVLDCDPSFAPNDAEARKTLREQFRAPSGDISTGDFLTSVKRALKLAGRDGRMPCTALILDEVQQYIGDSSDRSTLITEVVEAVSKQFDSQVIVVGAGQSALTDVKHLHKLLDRFTIRVALSDADVETVTRKVLLQKKPAAIVQVRTLLDTHAGEVSRELQGTRIAECVEDRDVIVDDYPLLPVRRRFWEACFRQVDAAGTHSQLRSQLRIIHDAVGRLSDRPLGAVVTADELYEALAPEMVNTGVLLREINEKIINLSKNGSEPGRLARRICGLIFLIGKLPREAGADIGVRATASHIGDLLVDDLRGDASRLRADVEAALTQLASSGVLMQVGDEYRLQTREGAEWDREFRNRQTRLANDDAHIQIRRDALLYAQADAIIRTVKLLHGTAKESRQFQVHRDQAPPQAAGDGIPLWVRDGWTSSEKEVTSAARAAGSDSPLVCIFVPRQSADDLRRLVIEAEASRQTLDAKGVPTTDEGREARLSMESRERAATQQITELVGQIVDNAKVFQGGGTELLQLKLEDKLRDAATAALARLYPRFGEADSNAWEVAIKRARDGSDMPFQPVGHAGSTEQHPVCQQVLATIGAGKTGSEVRKTLRASPFGWPQDAIDAALIALHRSQHLTATLNGAALAQGQLDQNKIAKTEFRVEKATLSVQDRLRLRKLFQAAGITCKAGEENAKAALYLEAMAAFAQSAGGDPPLPACPATPSIADLQALVGNEQLTAILAAEGALQGAFVEWSKRRSLVDQRLPQWRLAERMAAHASELPSAADPVAQLESVRAGRLLLEATDPVSPLRVALATVLRAALNEAHERHQSVHATGMDELRAHEAWSRLSSGQQSEILTAVGLAWPPALDVSSDEALLAALDRSRLSARLAEADAVAGRVERAIETAAKLVDPQSTVISLERATLRTEADVEAWLGRQRRTLLEGIQRGPVIIG